LTVVKDIGIRFAQSLDGSCTFKTRSGAMLKEMAPTGRGFDPVREMQRAQIDLNRLFGGLRLYARSEFPLVNLWTSPDGSIVEAEVPGLKPEELDITVRRDTVILRGSRKPEPMNDSAAIQRQERMHGDFARSIVLPFSADADKASAKFERGILTLTLPRPEDDKPRRIKIA
jgi:HSP20 family protein